MSDAAEKEAEERAYDAIMRILRDLDIRSRGDVLTRLRHNNEFCGECGSGWLPCYCWYDE